MIFFPEKNFYEKPEDYGLEYEEVSIAVSAEVQLFGWMVQGAGSLPAGRQGKNAGYLLFFHGNAGNISHRLYKIKGWVERGFSVLLIDYRSYGESTGHIQQGEDIIEDARAAFEWLTVKRNIPPAQIVLYGESLGSHPAIRLATSNRVAAVILEAPFTSFFELAKKHYPFVPTQLIKEFEFSNIRWIGQIKSPLFILHGTEDQICPYAMAGELFERAPEPKGFLSIPNGQHNDLPTVAGEDYYQKPFEFLVKNAFRSNF